MIYHIKNAKSLKDILKIKANIDHILDRKNYLK